MTTAAAQRTSVAVSHLLTRTLVRDTGFEIVQASVPLSRSAMSRLIVAEDRRQDDELGTDREQEVVEWLETDKTAAAGPSRPSPGTGRPRSSAQPLDNLLFAIGTQFIVLAAIFNSMSLLIAERDSGTLAWTISKPVSRTSG